MVEKAKLPISKKYHFSIYDNPANIPRIDQIIATIREGCATQEEFEARVGGKWIAAGNRVSCYNPDKHKRNPPTYNPETWRHMGVVDPSASGKTGITVWAEDPTNGKWYNVLAKYLDGDAAFVLVDEVEKEFSPYNIQMRVCDSNPAGFYKEAHRRSIKYRTVADIKAGRKHDLIDLANTRMLSGKMYLTNGSGPLEDELVSCVWNENNPDKIVNASRFHCFDTFQYAAANIPKFDPEKQITRSHEQQVLYDWRKVRSNKQKKKAIANYKIVVRNQRRASRGKRKRGTTFN